jgi:phosphoesterase RecJ-like protein
MDAISETERMAFRKLLEKHRSVTVLSHIHPDADAIGTSLGIYTLLRKEGWRTEVANATADLPRNLDFLEGFARIKKKIDFDDSLIIACDCGSLDRLGFEVDGREIVVIDHHPSNTGFGSLNLVRSEAASSSEVAFRLLEPLFPIPRATAEAFYAALISDTRHFTTPNVGPGTFELARELIALGAEPAAIAQAMLQRRSLASLRVLGRALESLRLLRDAQVAVMTVTREDLAATGARYEDLDGLVDYARSLVTVEIAILLVERRDSIKVSLRSKGVDVMRIARDFGGGGHREAAGFEVRGVEIDTVMDALLDAIEKEGVLQRR